MQVNSLSSQSPTKCAAEERFQDLNEELRLKLKMGGSGEEEEEEEVQNLEKSLGNDGEMEEEEEGEEEEEFSFVGVQGEGSPISAEEAFQNGLIRPVYPLFDKNLLVGYEFEYNEDAESLAMPPLVRKVFVEDRDGGGGDDDSTSESVESSDPQGPFCLWTEKTVAEASPETCRKSNSTGFSRLWRFRDLLMRSSSDGKDAFVFIKSEASAASSSAKQSVEKKEKTKKTRKKETMASVHEKLYGRNRASREEAKRRSYLPYKQVGFFTDVNGLSKNIHPF